MNRKFLDVAENIKPRINITIAEPIGFTTASLKAGEEIILDFGNHIVGYLTLRLNYVGAHPDAPAWVKLRFAERDVEFSQSLDDYTGWISKAWVQEEDVRIDCLPTVLELTRRYAFRYISVKLVAAGGFGISVEGAAVKAVSSADDLQLMPFASGDACLDRLDKIACRTLHECMQTVFEDGPKRDRRLWLGDLRIQALVNYVTYRNFDLVKRCLYIFAACTRDDGVLPASVFIEPEIEGADGVLFDYSLLFIPALKDYFEASGDVETLRELWPVALAQIKWASEQFDDQGIVRDPETITWCFGDWSLKLNKQGSAQGTYLYALKAAISLAERLDDATVGFVRREYSEKRDAAKKYLWDSEKGLFKSGKNGEFSWASQIWLSLGGAIDIAEMPELFQRMESICVHRP